MGLLFLLLCLCVFLVELPIIYAPLYFFSYKLIGADKKIQDRYLVIILVSLTILLAVWLFPLFFNAITNLLF